MPMFKIFRLNSLSIARYWRYWYLVRTVDLLYNSPNRLHRMRKGILS
jgi:hypothetical protein